MLIRDSSGLAVAAVVLLRGHQLVRAAFVLRAHLTYSISMKSNLTELLNGQPLTMVPQKQGEPRRQSVLPSAATGPAVGGRGSNTALLVITFVITLSLTFIGYSLKHGFR